jgi:hypothetical protein
MVLVFPSCVYICINMLCTFYGWISILVYIYIYAKFAQGRFWWTSTYLGTMVWFFFKYHNKLVRATFDNQLFPNSWEPTFWESINVSFPKTIWYIWPLLFWILKIYISEKTNQVFQDFVITVFDKYLKKQYPPNIGYFQCLVVLYSNVDSLTPYICL